MIPEFQEVPFASGAIPILFDAGIKSVLVLAVAGLAVCGMRKSSAAARHLVWLLAVTSLPVLPLLSLALPGWHILPHWLSFRPASIEQPVFNQNVTAAPNINGVPPVELQNVPDVVAPTSEFAAPAPLNTQQTGSLPQPSPRPRVNWWNLVLPVWIAVAALALLPVMCGHLSLWRLERRSRPETEATWLELLRTLVSRLKLKRAVALLKTDRRRMPMTWGIFRPRLLLPEHSQAWPEDRRRVVLLHELAHAKRWDYLTNLITQLSCALYWFNPLVWVAARQMIAERERACDDIVLRHGAKPADYAEQILQIAAGLHVERFAAYTGIAMARRSTLEGRLRAILDKERNRGALTRALVAAAIVLLAVIVIPVAMIKAAPAASPSPATSGSDTNSIALARQGDGISPQDSGESEATPDATRPFAVKGRVTDPQGKPLAGVTLTAHCGIGSLRPTGETQTASDGSYTLRFREGWSVKRDDGGWGVGVQAATISSRLSGYFETNLHRGGDLLMADYLPAPGEDVGWKVDPAKLVLINRPYELNFVMQPAAKVSGHLLNERTSPLANTKVWLDGDALPPSSSVLAETQTDQDGRFQFEDVPTGYTWRVNLDGKLSKKLQFREPGDWTVRLFVRNDFSDAQTLESATAEPQRPATLVVRYDIPGDSPETALFLQRTNAHDPPWPRRTAYPRNSEYGSTNLTGPRWLPDMVAPNKGELVLSDLLPGTYQISRTKHADIPGGDTKQLPMPARFDFRTVVLEPGRTQRVDYVRSGGQAIRGTIEGLKDIGAAGAYILVRPANATTNLSKETKLQNYDVTACGPDGEFQIPMLQPGDYTIVAAAYKKPVLFFWIFFLFGPSIEAPPFDNNLPDVIAATKVTIRPDSQPARVRIPMTRKNSQQASNSNGALQQNPSNALPR